ncbi:MAG: monovalent cation/H+ antiporter subunit D family protein, partial [Deltaproteobacteria bacterium]
METVVSSKLVWALVTPLIGSILVMLTSKRPNVREAISFLAAATMFGLVLSLIPAIKAGTMLVYPIFKILPGLSITLRADAMSMIFALVASSLWVLAVFYSMGYMRGLEEHAQTRFNACFALALFGAIGTAFSDNLFTMYLFYEIVS